MPPCLSSASGARPSDIFHATVQARLRCLKVAVKSGSLMEMAAHLTISLLLSCTDPVGPTTMPSRAFYLYSMEIFVFCTYIYIYIYICCWTRAVVQSPDNWVASVDKKYHTRLAALPQYTSGQLVCSVSQKKQFTKNNNNPLLLLACSFMQVPAYWNLHTL